MNYLPMMRRIVETAVFLGLSDDSIVKPDAAVAQLEMLANRLQELGDAEKQHFTEFVRNLAESEQARTGKNERVMFLLSLCENIGI